MLLNSTFIVLLTQKQGKGKKTSLKYSPEPIGDYVAGPSHVLPTNSTARFSSGISASTFITRTSIIDVDVDSYTELAENAKIFGDLEGLLGHSKSATSRFD